GAPRRHVVTRSCGEAIPVRAFCVSDPGDSIGAMDFLPDDEQARALGHERGAMLVAGEPGTGKSAVLRERFARLIEGGADPERVALVVRSRSARSAARRALFDRLPGSLSALRVATVHGVAYQIVQAHHRSLEYEAPPAVL